MQVLTCGTGSKCLGEEELTSEGDLLADGHAEVVARRSLVRFLMLDMEGEEGVCLEKDGGGLWRMKEGMSLHLFVTHPPCGDAAISYKIEENGEKKLCVQYQLRENVYK